MYNHVTFRHMIQDRFKLDEFWNQKSLIGVNLKNVRFIPCYWVDHGNRARNQTRKLSTEEIKMLAVFRKIFVTSLVVLIALSTGAWQSHQPASGKSKDKVVPPLYPGINWSDQGASTQNIRINVKGDTVSLTGNKYAAKEQ